MMKKVLHIIIFFSAALFFVQPGAKLWAQDGKGQAHLTQNERLSIARDFVEKMKAGLSRVEEQWSSSKEEPVENILSEGEMLLLQPVVGRSTRLDGIIMAEVHNNKIQLSLSDFVRLLDLAIEVNPETGRAEGWYLREGRRFTLDVAEGLVVTEQGEFNVSDDVEVRERDIWVPAEELDRWIDFDLKVTLNTQELHMDTDVPLPVLARLNRRNAKSNRSYDVPDPSLPFQGDGYGLSSVPVIDVSTNSTYRKRGASDEGVDSHTANITTVGDFAKGTLRTQTRLDDQDKVSSLRVKYKKESLDGDLLGPLEATKLEVGDITRTNIPFSDDLGQELGARITNADPTKTFSRPTTGISGSAIPGWDVELYRNSQLLGFQEVGDDGFYQFTDVDLFLEDNNFRLVFYGPQGEIRERDVYVPVDRGLQSQGKGVYDVSVSMDGESTYMHTDPDYEDKGALNISALYEKPLSKGVTALASFRSNQQAGERDYVASAGLSTTVYETLLNAGIAVDDEGEAAANLVARRDFGRHEVRNSIDWNAAGFDNDDTVTGGFEGNLNISDDQLSGFSNTFQINGPVWSDNKYRLRYSASNSYSWDGNGDYDVQTNAGLNFGLPRMNANGLLVHRTGTNIQDDELDSILTLSGRLGEGRLRLTGNYEFKPDNELKTIYASYNRDLTDDLDIDLSVTKRQEQSITEYQARLDWQAGFVRISPSVRYNTQKDFFAGLNTRFGVVKDPSTGEFKMFDQTMGSMGVLSAFVYLDKNGDGKFNEGEQPLKDVLVTAPQSGRRVRTDENGIAFFKRMNRLKLTDVYVDPQTLQDPAWIPGFEGVSVLPREGYVAQVDFPVHMSGELDGVVYARAVQSSEPQDTSIEPKPIAIRNVTLNLYNEEGEIEQTATTDPTGFYYFTQIPPGRYFLMIDEDSAARKQLIRPEPQPVEIGYEGTIIYGNDIYVRTGQGDIPSEIVADMQAYKENHPHINFDRAHDLVLNLGAYNSRLLMSVVWYKLRSRYGAILGQAKPFVPPAESYADAETGKHTLRVGLGQGANINEAYARCRALMARDQYCKVEIYPSYMKQAMADDAASQPLPSENIPQ